MSSTLINYSSIFSIIVAPFALAFGCGQPNQKIDINNSLLSASADPNCNPGACPEVEYSLVDGAGKSLDSASQSGAVGKNFSWSVKVKSSAPSSRIKIAVVQKAQWMLATGSSTDGGGLDISGKPTEAVSQNSVVILARDMGRCAAMEKVPKDCSSPEKSFDQYDKKFQMKYTISGGSSDVTPSNVTPSNDIPSNVTPSNNSSSNSLCGGILGSVAKILPIGGSLGCK